MKRKFIFFFIILAAFVNFGFSSGSEKETAVKKTQNVEPVTKYEEYPKSDKSNQELFQEYHIIIITSLEEAQSAFSENPVWALRMLRDADNYFALLTEMLSEDPGNKFLNVKTELKEVISCIENKNVTEIKKNELRKKTSVINSVLKKELGFPQVKQWVKK